MKVHTRIHHETRFTKINSDKFPVVLRISFKGNDKYYQKHIATGYDLTKSDFKAVMGTKPRKKYKGTRDKLNFIESKAQAIISGLEPFEWEKFLKKFYNKTSDSENVYTQYEEKIKELQGQKRLGSAYAYKCSLHSLKEHRPEILHFKEVSVKFLSEYENWMLNKQHNSITTVGIYLRALRAIIREAIAKGELQEEYYPFGKYKYIIPAGRNIKKALTIEDIGMIQKYDALTEGETKAKDYWLFSYYGNGMNFKDIALLKWENIKGDYIVFERAKIVNTGRANSQKISVFILPEMWAIIKRQGNKNIATGGYLFPILKNPNNAEQVRRDILQNIHTTNKYMDRIAIALKIKMPITTYTARHSFATILKRSGVAVEFISEAIGHRSIQTTRSYLDSFENETKKQIAQKLIPAFSS